MYGISKKISSKCELNLDGSKIKQVEKLIYLGSLITEDGRCDGEIKRRIDLAKDAFQKLENIPLNIKLSIEVKKRILDCYVISTLTYESVCWTISAQLEA